MSLGPAEIIVVLVIALLVFGPTRLPEVGRQVGRTMREFKKFQETIRQDVSSAFHDDAPVDATKAAEPPPSLPPKADSGAESSPSEPASSEPSPSAPSPSAPSPSAPSPSAPTSSAPSPSAPSPSEPTSSEKGDGA